MLSSASCCSSSSDPPVKDLAGDKRPAIRQGAVLRLGGPQSVTPFSLRECLRQASPVVKIRLFVWEIILSVSRISFLGLCSPSRKRERERGPKVEDTKKKGKGLLCHRPPLPWSRSGKACSSEHACRVCLSYHGSSSRYGHTCAYRPASCVGQRYGPRTQKVCSPRVPLRVLPLFTGASCNMSRDRACWSTAHISMPWTHAMLMRLADKQETEASSAPAHKRAQAEHSPTHRDRNNHG